MNTHFAQLVEHFVKHELRYQANEERQYVRAHFTCEAGGYDVIALIDCESDVFQVFARAPFAIPKGARTAVAEAIIRANYGMKIGKFEMDLADGELRFHVAHILADATLSDRTIRRVIGTGLATMDRYLPAVLSIVYGNELPEDAIRCVEQTASST